MPVLHVFGRREIDAQECAARVAEALTEPCAALVLVYDALYAHAVDDVAAHLSRRVPVVRRAACKSPDVSTSPHLLP